MPYFTILDPKVRQQCAPRTKGEVLHGAIPLDLNGCFVRTGPNPRFPELLDQTRGGLLTDDHPDALADAIEGLLLDPENAQRLGAAGREHVLQHFTVEAMARGALSVYEAAAEQTPA